MKKIKVMHMIWSMKAGGAQQIVLNYLKGFHNDKDIEIKLYVFDRSHDSKYDNEIKENNYDVVYLNNPHTKCSIPVINRVLQLLITQKAWYNAILDYEPDIVHVHISALLAHVLLPILKAKVPIRFDTLHSDPRVNKGWRLNRIKKAFTKKGFIPVCLNETQAHIAQQYYGIRNYVIVPNGVDFNVIKANQISKFEAREKLGYKANDFIILACGRLNPVKRFDLLLEVFAKVTTINPNAVLLIAGDGEEKDRLVMISKKLGILNKVHFLGNINNVVPYYCVADVMAITSSTEAFSLVAVEAQACGLKCVISAGVPKEIIFTHNVIRMKPEATIDNWVDAIVGKTDYSMVQSNISQFDNQAVNNKLKSIYINEYKKFTKSDSIL